MATTAAGKGKAVILSEVTLVPLDGLLLALQNEPADAVLASLHGGEALLRNGECLGIVRSAAYGHTLGRTIVTGYVECPPGVEKVTPKWLRAGSWAVSGCAGS